MKIKVLLIFLISLAIKSECLEETESNSSGANTEGGISCKDEKGRNVDWFYWYKLPRYYKSNAIEEKDETGLSYLYMTSKKSNSWYRGKFMANESESLLGRTLEPFLENENVLVIAYNDKLPQGKADFAGSHAIGLVATDGKTGIWITHSIPGFPDFPKYEFPDGSRLKGQSLICVTIDVKQIETIAMQLIYNEPTIYHAFMPEAMRGKYPNMEAVLSGLKITQEPYYKATEIESLEGTKFLSLVKGPKTNNDLYTILASEVLNDNLLGEFCHHALQNLPSNCTQNWSIKNIVEIESKEFQFAFDTTSDHSKWIVSETGNWICVGDANRNVHQLYRGGGILCQSNAQVANAYRSLIGRIELCDPSHNGFLE